MSMDGIQRINCPSAPKPLGNYSHAVAFGELVFVSGIASRDFKTDKVPGLILDGSGKKVGYDIRLETRATLENIKVILEDAGSSMDDVIEIQTYLLDMKDFAAYNEIFAGYFPTQRPARTTVGVASLPGHVSIEMRVVAAGRGKKA